MSETAGTAHRLNATALEAARALIGQGRIQSSVRNDNIIHERQAVLEAVDIDQYSLLHFTGDGHDSRLNVSQVASLIYQEETAQKTGRIMPRLSFMDSGNKVIMMMVGLEGEAPFRSALGPFLGAKCDKPPASPRPSTPVDDKDIGLLGLSAFIGKTIAISFNQNAASSQWVGLLQHVKKGQNFVNIIQPGFHLHLRSAVVANWVTDTNRRSVALDAAGDSLGLAVEEVLI